MELRTRRDPFRETWLRYTAFTSDFGESLKPFISRRLYLASYGIVALYGAADTVDKGLEAWRRQHGVAVQQQQQLCSPVPASALSAATMRACCSRSPQGLAQACADSATFLLTATAAAAGVAGGAAAANSARESRSHAVPVAAAVADTAAWHGLASLLIPGLLINRTVCASGRVLAAYPHLLPWRQVARAAPSVAGLSMLLLVPQVDAAVNMLFDGHVRPRLGTAWLGHCHSHTA